MIVVPIFLVLLLGPAGPGQAADPPSSEPGPSRVWDQAPPGSPEDVALWNALRDAQNGAVLHMARVAQASFRLRYGTYYESLDEKARTGTPAEAEAARAARSRIESAAKDADDAIPKQGLRVRTCKYTLLHLDQHMAIPDDPAFQAEMPAVRAEARDCVAALAPFAATVRAKADALEASLAAADALLGRSPPVLPSERPAAPTAAPR